MELLGIPIVPIIIIIWILLSNYTEEQKKEKEKISKKWDNITTGMSETEVIGKLGQPHRIWRAGAAEIWVYGSSDSNGQIRFLDGKIIAYERSS
ncbi:MAG: hypothetical protein A2167_01855 [Planctomycetes bacterium RBG_13_46_10]|nr:MAG: hypothetical protein A2167_01855 [Planctomycetes bacterium RBG_13_46_10]QBM02893.1 hypothetical protein [uncultured archaeon]